jgi:hypothetical protein
MLLAHSNLKFVNQLKIAIILFLEGRSLLGTDAFQPKVGWHAKGSKASPRLAAPQNKTRSQKAMSCLGPPLLSGESVVLWSQFVLCGCGIGSMLSGVFRI